MVSKKPRLTKWEKREFLKRAEREGFTPVQPKYAAGLLKTLGELLDQRPADRIFRGEIVKKFKRGKYIDIFGVRFIQPRR